MARRHGALLVAALAATLAGCGGSDEGRREACGALPMVAFAARAIDAVSGAPVRLTAVRVSDAAGTLRAQWLTGEAGQAGPAGPAKLDVKDNLAVLWQETGRFNLQLQADGYAAYQRDDLVVAVLDPICGYPATVTFDAPMQALLQ